MFVKLYALACATIIGFCVFNPDTPPVVVPEETMSDGDHS
jgi:hypothetical protein